MGRINEQVVGVSFNFHTIYQSRDSGDWQTRKLKGYSERTFKFILEQFTLRL